MGLSTSGGPNPAPPRIWGHSPPSAADGDVDDNPAAGDDGRGDDEGY